MMNSFFTPDIPEKTGLFQKYPVKRNTMQETVTLPPESMGMDKKNTPVPDSITKKIAPLHGSKGTLL
jgi:hypothetical protein